MRYNPRTDIYVLLQDMNLPVAYVNMCDSQKGTLTLSALQKQLLLLPGIKQASTKSGVSKAMLSCSQR